MLPIPQPLAPVAPMSASQPELIPHCPVCQQPIVSAWNFCPNCGHSLREQPLSLSIWKQLGIYLLSFFLPPFGLTPAFKYLKQKDPKAKLVGLIAIILTAASIIVLILSYKAFMDYYAKILNSLTHPY